MKKLLAQKYTKPFTEIKSILLHFHGKYPHIFTPLKDITFPQRIFPNAKFYIRCNARDPETRIYFAELYKDFEFEIVDEKANTLNLDIDAVFAKQEGFSYYGGVIEKYCMDYNIMLNTFKGKIFILYNDEALRPFDTLDNEYKNRPETWFIRNKNILNKIPKRTFDYSNTLILANDNRISNWVEDGNFISQYAIDNNIGLMYLTDKVLYDLPDTIDLTKFPKTKNIKLKGIFISLFFGTRIPTWNRIMRDESLDLKIYGTGSQKLKYYKVDKVELIPNTEIPEYYYNHDYSLYMGKGTESLYLGATFFVPLLNYCPLFIWRGTDPNEKLFPGIDCYYDDSEQLAQLLNKYETDDKYSIEELWKSQIRHIL